MYTIRTTNYYLAGASITVNEYFLKIQNGDEQTLPYLSKKVVDRGVFIEIEQAENHLEEKIAWMDGQHTIVNL